MTEKSAAARRRYLLNAASASGAIGLAGFPMIAAAQAPVVFRFQGAWSTRDIYHEYALDYARRTVGWALDAGTDPRLAYDHWFSGQAAVGKY